MSYEKYKKLFVIYQESDNYSNINKTINYIYIFKKKQKIR